MFSYWERVKFYFCCAIPMCLLSGFFLLGVAYLLREGYSMAISGTIGYLIGAAICIFLLDPLWDRYWG